MKRFRIIAVLVGIGCALDGHLSLGQDVPTKELLRPEISRKAAEISAAEKRSERMEKILPAKVEKSRLNSTDQVKKLLEEIKTSRVKFLQDQKEIQRKLSDATEDQRDQIRQELRDKREQFLEQQKDLREEVLRRVNELRDQLKDRQDLIDNAKDQGKGKPHKGGN